PAQSPEMTALATIQVHSPFTGELVGEAPSASPERVATMLDAGARHSNTLSRHERSRILFAVAEALAAREDELARLISPEPGLGRVISGGSGVCLKETHHEVTRSLDVFRFAAIEALRDDGETFAGDVTPNGRDRRAHTLAVPVALVGAITPFNHPLNQVAHKL